MIYLIDTAIILVFIIFIIDGYREGFVKNFLELLGFVLSLFVAYLSNDLLSSFLVENTAIPLSLSRIIAFLSVWLLIDIIVTIILYFIFKKIPEDINENKTNKYLGLIPAFFKATIIILVFLIFTSSLPFKESLYFRDRLDETRVARLFLGQSSKLQKPYEVIFGNGLEDLVTFFTLPPQSEKSIEFQYEVREFNIDESAERAMLELINKERQAEGQNDLILNEKLTELARNHSKDMFERGYFSHYTPEGLSPFDRMELAEIHYIVAGENLALAPSVTRAHFGLMESPSHRDNILNPDFNKIGIGALNGGIYGIMFTQEFTN